MKGRGKKSNPGKGDDTCEARWKGRNRGGSENWSVESSVDGMEAER